MATGGQFYWPSVGTFVAAYGQFFMAAYTGIKARAGSDFLFRLLGTPLGSSHLPVGVDVRLISAGADTQVFATSYDRLGWYFNKKLVWGEHVMDRKLTDLLNAVRAAANKPPLPERKATFSP